MTSPAISRGVVGSPPAPDETAGNQAAVHRADGIRSLLIPLGATEQHGPHLPLATDTLIATAWANAAASRVEGAVVAPALPYGSSGEHRGFAGTMSIGRDALYLVIVELVRSVAGFCDRVVLVSGHGGNAPVLGPAIEQLTAEGHEVSWMVPRWPGDFEVDAHGGQTETSLLLHLQADVVAPFTAVAGNTTPLADLMPTLRTDGVAAVAPNGGARRSVGGISRAGGPTVRPPGRHAGGSPVVGPGLRGRAEFDRRQRASLRWISDGRNDGLRRLKETREQSTGAAEPARPEDRRADGSPGHRPAPGV